MSHARLSRIEVAAVLAAGLLAVLGLAVAGYLVTENLRGDTGICVGTQGCHTVQSSRYGKMLGIPVSVPGALLYAALAVAAAGYYRNVAGRRAEFALAGFFGSLAGLLMSAYLTYVEAFVLDAWCSYCIVSALLMVALFAVWSVLLAFATRGPVAPLSALRDADPASLRR